VSTTVRLRRWQRRALERLEGTSSSDFLAVATPGAGKTTFALVALRRRMADLPGRRVVVVAPTAHLKTQWARAAARFGLTLEDRWRPGAGALPRDVHGVVTTYQQVASATGPLAALADGGLVVLDEIHHAGDERAWGQGVRTSFTGAAWRLGLSGTPFRSDSHAIPFVRYALDEALPDFEYGYGDALADRGVIRHVEFPSLDGEMEWIDAEGSTRTASFGETLSGTLASQRLRTALSVDGEWLPAVIDAAHARLTGLRRERGDAGGLVIATDQEHARAIAELIRRRHGVRAVVATSDDAEASSRIARFATSNEPWLVAVRMVSEGVDIPRLAVGVYATTTTTELFFRQAVGRFVRARRGDGDLVAALYLPADRRLRLHADEIARIRRHRLVTAGHRRVVESDDPAGDPAEQMSLFAAVSATPVGAVDAAETSGGRSTPVIDDADEDDDGLVLELPPLPSSERLPDAATATRPAATMQRRRHLRHLNAARAADLVHHANLSHASVNAELNRLAGITRITEATESQLERRLAAAERWLNT
jgi:superfamily II DNA or RNA helicase